MSLEDDLQKNEARYLESLGTREIRFVVDDDDYESIQNAIAQRQTVRIGGELIIAAGKGELRGRLLAEICRGWMSYRNATLRGWPGEGAK